MQKMYSGKIQTISDPSNVTMITEDGVIAEMIIEVDGDSEVEHIGSFSPEINECTRVLSSSVVSTMSKLNQCSGNGQKLCSSGLAEVESTCRYVPKKNKILKNGSSWNIFNSNKNNLSSDTPVEDSLMELDKEKDDSELQNNQTYPERSSFSIQVESGKLEVESNILKDTDIGMLNLSLDTKLEKSSDVTPVEEVKVVRALFKPIKRRGKRKDAKSSKRMRTEENLNDGVPNKISEASIVQKGPDISSNPTNNPSESSEVIMNISANSNINDGIKLKSSSKEWKNLGSISHVNERVNSATQYSLKAIHQILFDQFIPTNVDDVKKEILEFDGFAFTNDSQQSKNRIKLMKLLSDFTLEQTCDILGVNDGTKEEMISNILSFLFETFNASVDKTEDTLQPVVSLKKLSNDLVRYQRSKSDGNEESKTKPENNAVPENSCTRVLRSSKKLIPVQPDRKPVISKKKETKISKAKVSCKDLPSKNPAKMESEMASEDSSSLSSSSTSSESAGEDILDDRERKTLGQLSEVRKNINKCTSQQLQTLHAFLFNNVDKPEALKRNVLQFDGFKFRPQSSKWMRKEFVLSLIAPSKLKEMADLLHLPCFCQKQRIMISTIMKFLSFPQESLLKSYAHDPVPVLTVPDNRPSTRRKKRVMPVNNNNESSGVLPVQRKKVLKKVSSPVSNKLTPWEELQVDENLKEMKMLLRDIRRKRALKKSGYSIRSVNNLNSSPENKKKKLESIPNVQFMIITSNYEDLQDLHQLLYLRPASKARIRRNILDFDGFAFEQDSDYYEIRIALLNKLGYEVAKRIAFFLGLASLGTTVPHRDLNELILHFLMCPSSIQIKPITHFPQNFFNNLPRQSSSVNASPIQKALKKQGSNKRSSENNACAENPVSQKIAKKVKVYPNTCKVRRGRKRKFSKRLAMMNSAKKTVLKKGLATVSFEEDENTLNTENQEEEDVLNAGKQEEDVLNAVGGSNLSTEAHEKRSTLSIKRQGKGNNMEQEKGNILKEEKGNTLKQEKRSTLKQEKRSTLKQERKNILKQEREYTLKQEEGSTLRHEKGNTLKQGKRNTLKQEKGSTLKQEKGSTLKQEKKSTLKQEKGSTLKQEKDSIFKQKKENILKSGETNISDEEKKNALVVEEEQGKESILILKEQKVKTPMSSKRFLRKTMLRTKKEFKKIESLTKKAVPPANIDSESKDMSNNVINSGSNISFKNTVQVEPSSKTNYTGENVLKRSNCDVNKLNTKNDLCNEKVTGISCLGSNPPSVIKHMEVTSPSKSSTHIKSLSPLNEKLNVSPEGVKIRTIMLAPPGSHPGNSLKAVAVLNNNSALYPRYLPTSTMSTSLLKFNSSTLQTSQINFTARQNLICYKSPPLNIQTSEMNSSKNQTGISQNFLSNSNRQHLLYQDGKAIYSILQKQVNNVSPTQSDKLAKGSPNLVLLNDKTSLMQPKSTCVGNDPHEIQVPTKLSPKLVTKPSTATLCAIKANSLSTCGSLITSSSYHNTTTCENTLEASAAENDGKALISELQKCIQKINQLNANKDCQKLIKIIKIPSKAHQSSVASSLKNGNIFFIPLKNTSQQKPVLSTTASMENTNIHSVSLSKAQNKPGSLNAFSINTTEADDLRTPDVQKSNVEMSDDMKNLFTAQDHKHPSHPVLLTSKEEYVLPCDISNMTENLEAQVNPRYSGNFIDLTQEDTTGSEQGDGSVSKISVKNDPLSGSSKNQAAFNSDSDYDEEPLSHLIGHPSDETLFKHVYDFVICSRLSDITMRSVVQKIYDLYPQYDLSYRKAFLKDTVKKIVCSISSGCWPKS